MHLHSLVKHVSIKNISHKNRLQTSSLSATSSNTFNTRGSTPKIRLAYICGVSQSNLASQLTLVDVSSASVPQCRINAESKLLVCLSLPLAILLGLSEHEKTVLNSPWADISSSLCQVVEKKVEKLIHNQVQTKRAKEGLFHSSSRSPNASPCSVLWIMKYAPGVPGRLLHLPTLTHCFLLSSFNIHLKKLC